MSEKIVLKNPTHTKAEYNEEEVYYCLNCLSLRVVNISDLDYCDKCGSIDIRHCNIKEWEEKYIKKYGHKYIQNGK